MDKNHLENTFFTAVKALSDFFPGSYRFIVAKLKCELFRSFKMSFAFFTKTSGRDCSHINFV